MKREGGNRGNTFRESVLRYKEIFEISSFIGGLHSDFQRCELNLLTLLGYKSRTIQTLGSKNTNIAAMTRVTTKS